MIAYLWDSCVFIAYLNDERAAYDIPSVEQFLSEAGAGACQIYTSSIAFAEITPSRMSGTDHANFASFLRDMRSAITVIDAGPIVCAKAAELKDIKYRKGNSDRRILTTGDAIMLATALELEDSYGVKIDALHTYDMGRGKGNPEGKGVPLIGLSEWVPNDQNIGIASRALSLNICKPVHNEPPLIGEG